MPQNTDQLLDHAPCVSCDTYAAECDGVNQCHVCRADDVLAEILAAHFAAVASDTVYLVAA